ncbi:hypothetical protein [Actinomadura verrucosospora]|uniref:Uncharacterized protein n=1 Tax=Actinomadura verrucosospora TaxID=46165 RepID=A0A7D3W329_ACTVE|nr:hypothetical protein [Actinomadura verrucosospora]QKG24871.1 hypothetical protein ACTIVE_6522 [Actinomadura verrucosospora]
MSGPRDTRETAEEAGAATAPAASAPPSFGAAPPAGGSVGTEAAPAAQAPIDESAAPATAGGAAPADEASASSLRLPAFGLQTPWWAAEPAGEPAEAATPAAPEAAAPTEPAGEPPAGTLVAGVGVPSVDSRRAVPSEPLRKRPLAFGDTDPDGFAAVRDGVEPVAEAPSAGTTTGPMGIAPPVPAKDGEPAEPAPAEPAPAQNITEQAAQAEPTEETRPVQEPPSPPRGSADGTSPFEKAKEAEKASAAVAPVLVPDAILPPGVLPPTGSGPYPQNDAGTATATAEQPVMAPVITPVYHSDGGVPLDQPGPAGPGGPGAPPAPGARPRGGGGKGRVVLIGGGAAVVLAALAALFALGTTGSKSDGATRKDAEPTRAASAPPKANTPPKPRPIDINDEKTDPKDLSFTEAFPEATVTLGSRTFARDRWSINENLGYAARGSMLKALQRESCRKVVRATFVNKIKTWAVTTGIAVMPNRAAALRVSRAGDPGKYEWFRGMSGKQAKDVDRAGGYAAVTVRGRYVIYAYVQDPGGDPVKPGNKLAKQIAQDFLGYDARPIEARAHG